MTQKLIVRIKSFTNKNMQINITKILQIWANLDWIALFITIWNKHCYKLGQMSLLIGATIKS